MGRVGKYKKIKTHDPFYRGPRRNKKDTDLCPENDDDQPVPKSLVRLMRRAETLKNSRNRKRQKRQDPSLSASRTHSSISEPTEVTSRDDRKGDGSSQEGPMFTKRRGESLKSYFERIDVEANSRIMEAYRKNRKPSERRKRHLEERKKKALARRKGLCQDDIVEFSDLQDDVKFGEVVQAPPQLAAKPRGSKTSHSTSSSLLLHHKTSLREDHNKVARPSQGLKRKLDLETERERVINVYRHKKKTALGRTGDSRF